MYERHMKDGHQKTCGYSTTSAINICLHY